MTVHDELCSWPEDVEHSLGVFVLGVAEVVVHPQACRTMCLLLEGVEEGLVDDNALEHVDSVE